MGGEAPAAGWTLHALLPRPADVRLLRDGAEVARLQAPALAHEAEGPGVYRVEASLETHGPSARGCSRTRSICVSARCLVLSSQSQAVSER